MKQNYKLMQKNDTEELMQIEVCMCAAMRSVSACTSLTLYCVAPRLCHSGQTHRFRRCSLAAVGALEYPRKNSRNGNKEELYLLYFTLNSQSVHQTETHCFSVLYLRENLVIQRQPLTQITQFSSHSTGQVPITAGKRVKLVGGAMLSEKFPHTSTKHRK